MLEIIRMFKSCEELVSGELVNGNWLIWKLVYKNCVSGLFRELFSVDYQLFIFFSGFVLIVY
jgi:hypothetical protein